MGQQLLDSTLVCTKTPDAKILPLDSTPFGEKTPDPKTLTLPTDSSKRKNSKKEYVP